MTHISTIVPDEKIAVDIVTAMTGERVSAVERMTTGNQNYVYAVTTENDSYVIRLTTPEFKKRFIAALHWQNKLLPLGVPLAKFIGHDLENRYAPFPSLLMKRLQGTDIGKTLDTLTREQTKALALEMAVIHQATRVLPEGAGFGYAASYEMPPPHPSWYALLMKDLHVAINRIRQSDISDQTVIAKTLIIAEKLQPHLLTIRPQAFMPDTTVKNVMVQEGRLTGIVDVDDLCFGDPLFVLSLTYAGSEIDGHNTLYADCWAECLNLDVQALIRLEFYRLLHTVWFMGENSLVSKNGFQLNFDTDRLNDMYETSLSRLKNLYF